MTAAGAIGATSQADAALYYWQDADPSYYRSGPAFQPRRHKARRHQAKKDEAAAKQTGGKPQGALIIAVSIQKQKVRVYDANGFFAESPVSTGMPGHSTPMGVFSIVQKHRFHHSNIYSGAPMPYMQRITWSGVAMHAGVLPGYPASHGCIRMPMAFAMKMWNWTRMGARVIVTPDEMTPASFSHPLLVTQKVAPQPVAAEQPKVDAPLGVKSDKGADAGATARPATSETAVDLRPTVGHADSTAVLREQTRTADASGWLPAKNSPVTMSDAASSTTSAAGDTASAKADDTSRPDAKSETANKPTEAKSADNTIGEARSAEAAGQPETRTSEAPAPAPVDADAANAEVTATAGAKVEEKPAEAMADARAEGVRTEAPKIEAPKAEVRQADSANADTARPDTAKADAAKASEPKPAEKPAQPAKVATDAPAAAPDVKKDPARLPGVAKPEPPKRTGQIAVFISRKDSKLYVRQNFAPLFDVPVTIVPSDRPLGTHVFTAEADSSDANVLRWSVVSLPVTARNVARNGNDDRRSRRRKMAAAPAEITLLPGTDGPTEALDRITIPPDAMARIAEALTSGGSIVVSDQGIHQGETGQGTDFIVPLR
ncbi:L,D-transpeptidase family protein [Bradyrhizobium sp.]|uniref:L,D-transpeptidase family protein n=1 Tax=Bradyrhizobium sp. TaxID=376 RepID=UPI003C71A66D